jgi:Uma2 family endonuclease
MFTSDLRVRIPKENLATYPDLTIICGDPEQATDDKLAFTNPIVLVEVTSNSTERYDRTKKLDDYKTIDSLQEVVIVSHREPWLTLHRRTDDRSWTVLEARAGESVKLESVEATLSVDDVYA